DAGVFSAEVGGEDVHFADGFERWFALCGLAEDTTVRTLAVEGEAGAVALRAEKFELTVSRALRNVGIEIEEGVDVAAVARELGDCGAADRFGDGLIFGVYGDGFGGNSDGLLSLRDFELAVGAGDVAAADDHIFDD